MTNVTYVRSIETRYAGCRFRSRLEARWAVFFDAAGLRWHYEPQGYALRGGDGNDLYLPDFYVEGWRLAGRRLNVWVEVRGDVTALMADMSRLARASRVLPETPDGSLYQPSSGLPAPRLVLLSDVPAKQPTDRSEPLFPALACSAEHTDLLAVTRHRVIQQICVSELDPIFKPRLKVRWYTEPNDAVHFTAARCARFEHGETPHSGAEREAST